MADVQKEIASRISMQVSVGDLTSLSKAEVTRLRTLDWQSCFHSQKITEKECKLAIELESETNASLRSIIVGHDCVSYVQLFLKLLTKLEVDDYLECSLLFVNDSMDHLPGFSATFLNIGEKIGADIDPYEPFSRLLKKSNLFIREQAALALAKLFVVDPNAHKRSELEAFMDWLNIELHGVQSEGTDATTSPIDRAVPAVSALRHLLEKPVHRKLFHESGGSALIPALLRYPTSNVQVVYDVILCIWLLTYDQEILPSLDESHAVALIHDILQGAKREKVLRMCLYALRNMLEVQTFVQEMVSVGLYRSLKRLEKRKFADSDIPVVLGSIRERLDSEIILLSSFDQYYQEVRTGRLDWTPAHKSEKFWRENMERFEAKDFEVVRELAKLLDTSIDNRTVAVVCHDLGEFSRLHPRGKKIIRTLSVKEKIMRMMTTHNDEEVRKEALVCIQKMMVQNWEFLRS
eukprot:TRINITY_DN81603_c0_g1_i1.p1 TRINITY_DN81603_c0_g1~~TRINITY_DN81603_c0_g1_i1.p1  ORF type:complete len:463 (-),score=119.41 TRINITY_DN81603_c0_g1_i1:299-1687(-)